jgi:hypothetical protein
MQGKIFIPIIHKIVCLFLDVLGAKNRKAAIPSFTTGIVLIFRQALYKDGASKITKDLCRHGLLPESVVFLSPSQAGHKGTVRSIANQMELKTGEMPTLVAAASELVRRGNQDAVHSAANQMELKTGEMPTLAAAASELGRRGNQGALDAIVETGMDPEDAPTFCGRHAYDGNIATAVETRIDPKDTPSYIARRLQDSRRICTNFCVTENCKNTVQHIDGHCNPCRNLVPKKLKAEFCIGVGGRVCGRKNRTSKSMLQMLGTFRREEDEGNKEGSKTKMQYRWVHWK